MYLVTAKTMSGSFAKMHVPPNKKAVCKDGAMVITAPAAAPPARPNSRMTTKYIGKSEKVFADALEGWRAGQFGAMNRWKACKDTQEAERNHV